MSYDPDAIRIVEQIAEDAKKANQAKPGHDQVQSTLGRATILGQPCNDPQHAELNALLKERGWTDEQINHAHNVASGKAPLSDACPRCEEQELYYSSSVMIEGRRLIVCMNCDAQCVDGNEQAGPALLAQQLVGKAMKGKAGHKGRRVARMRPQG